MTTKPANLRARRERTVTKPLTWADTPAHHTAATKTTFGKSAAVYSRHQVPEGEVVFGAGFAEAGMGIDIVTGLPWGEKK